MAKKWKVKYETMRRSGFELVAAENMADAIGRVYLKHGYKGVKPMMLKIVDVMPLAWRIIDKKGKQDA